MLQGEPACPGFFPQKHVAVVPNTGKDLLLASEVQD